MNTKKRTSSGTIAIISSCTEDWGGSEELWGRSVPLLIEKGYGVTVYKSRFNRNHPEFVKLLNLGVTLLEIDISRSFLTRNFKRIVGKIEQMRGNSSPFTFVSNPWVKNLTDLLRTNNHEFAIISQGINFDGLGFGYACNLLNLPYVMIAQKAVDFYWPSRSDRPIMTKVLKEAAACYFVSKHNLRLTEEQFGTRLSNGHVIFNPQKIGEKVPYPSVETGYRLACVGRLFILDKGQDILLRILSKEKWRKRPLTVTFVGAGVDDEGLKDMATLLDVRNVEFLGQVKNMSKLWAQYHGLILPSRSEGLPLSLVEAMAAGRIAVISNAGGNTELIKEGETAFSAYPDETAFEVALDRAWEKREQWEELGDLAASRISTIIPRSPEGDFIIHCLNAIYGQK